MSEPLPSVQQLRESSRHNKTLVNVCAVLRCFSSDDTGYTVGLAMLDDLEIVYVHRLAGMHHGTSVLNLDGQPGVRLPALRTAAGRVLLANLSETARETLAFKKQAIEEGLDDPRVRTELARIRQEGYATEDNERPGRRPQSLVGIARPVRGITGEVLAAIDTTAANKPVWHLIGLNGRLYLAAEAISERLGDRRPHDMLAPNTMVERE